MRMSTDKDIIDVYDELSKVLNSEIKLLEENHRIRISLLQNNFARNNAKFKVGDFIGNVCGIIKVDKITGKIMQYNKSVHIIYHGLRYKKIHGVLSRTKDRKSCEFWERHGLKIIDGKLF